jgi:hypothetical protein
MKASREMLKSLLQKIVHTHDDELDCQQVFKLLDVYAEMSARGEDVSAAFPMVKQHLEMCNDCMEEYDALMRILETEGSS